MPNETLFDLQNWFSSIITRPLRETDELGLPVYDEATVREIEAKIPATPRLRPHQRIALYQQQYWWRLFSLLQESYPALLRLFGHSDFNAKIAEPYFLKHPPADWFLLRIGSSLPAWIRSEYSGSDRPLILPVAEIEEAYERLLYAPSIELFSFNADFFTFRAKLLEQEPDYWLRNDLPQLEKTKSFFVLCRSEGGVQYQKISKTEHLSLSQLKRGLQSPSRQRRYWERPSELSPPRRGWSGWI